MLAAIPEDILFSSNSLTDMAITASSSKVCLVT
jgi:hypothetical protein